jgi:hypothetical protein
VNSIGRSRITDEFVNVWFAPRGQAVVPHLEYVFLLVVDNRTWLEYHTSFPRLFWREHWIGRAEDGGVQSPRNVLHNLDLIVINEQVFGGICEVVLGGASNEAQAA